MELVLEQSQIQKLSPEMIQSMEILQMGMMELHEYVEELLLENPVLEREERYEREEGSSLLRKLEWLTAGGRSRGASYSGEYRDMTENMAASCGETLYDHLSAQVPWHELSPAVRRGVECVLTGLNDNGWLEETEQELVWRAGVSPEAVTAAESVVRGLEPAGVGARTLAQCLELQLTRVGETGLALTIVREHLEDLAKDHYNRIARATGASRETIQLACHRIRALDPRPGAPFAHAEPTAYVTPDVLVSEEDGRLVVSDAGAAMPELRISACYTELMRDSEDAEVREYLTQKVQQAEWVLKGIGRRRDTMLRCARCIAVRQEDFFRRGREFLRPMLLSEVAAEIGVHESTVSRAVRNKYVQCAWGLFLLSELFSRPVSAAREDVSAEQVKSRLRDLLEKEDRRRPLSDQKLCDALAVQGMTLARRTVAKYRDEMGYPSAPGRREV